MPVSFGRSLLAATGASLASLVGAADAPALPAAEAARLVAVSEEANDALMRGDIDRYRTLVPLSEDFTLMSPFGGTPSRAIVSEAHWAEIGAFFRNGALTVELFESYATPDMIVLAIIERARGVEVGGLPAQDWGLRVTLVYRRDAGDWRLVHRHADPLAAGITLRHAAALGRAETPFGE